MEQKIIGSWCEGLYSSTLLLSIEYGIDDYAVVQQALPDGKRGRKCHCKIHYDGENVYVVHNGHRYSFSNCMRA